MEAYQQMSNAIHHLQTLHNNPFIFAPALVAFFETLGNKEKSLLLGYLILPMTLHLPSREFLENSIRTSSIRTMLKDRARIYGLNERITQYREMVNITVQYLLNIGSLQLNEQLSVSIFDKKLMDSPSPKGIIKAASNLGKLFRPYEVPMIFRMLGVMSL
jgi:hypothetical protein